MTNTSANVSESRCSWRPGRYRPRQRLIPGYSCYSHSLRIILPFQSCSYGRHIMRLSPAFPAFQSSPLLANRYPLCTWGIASSSLENTSCRTTNFLPLRSSLPLSNRKASRYTKCQITPLAFVGYRFPPTKLKSKQNSLACRPRMLARLLQSSPRHLLLFGCLLLPYWLSDKPLVQ